MREDVYNRLLTTMTLHHHHQIRSLWAPQLCVQCHQGLLQLAPGMIFGDAISTRYDILRYVSNVDLLASSWYLVMRH